MAEDAEKKVVEETVQALGKAWDKWPIITCCGLVAFAALAALVYNQYRLFKLLEGFSCTG